MMRVGGRSAAHVPTAKKTTMSAESHANRAEPIITAARGKMQSQRCAGENSPPLESATSASSVNVPPIMTMGPSEDLGLRRSQKETPKKMTENARSKEPSFRSPATSRRTPNNPVLSPPSNKRKIRSFAANGGATCFPTPEVYTGVKTLPRMWPQSCPRGENVSVQLRPRPGRNPELSGGWPRFSPRGQLTTRSSPWRCGPLGGFARFPPPFSPRARRADGCGGSSRTWSNQSLQSGLPDIENELFPSRV